MICRSVFLPPVLALAAIVGACSESPSPTAPTAGTSSLAANIEGARTRSAPAPMQAAQNFEVRFLTDMIDHHAMGVAMAETCVQKAIHAELRDLCAQVIEAQSREIVLMQSWLQSWYGITHEPEMKPGEQRMLEKLAALTSAGFEIEFMEMLIKHHQRAIKESLHCVDKAWHAELRQLCQQMAAAQSQEITRLRAWLCQWYGRCK